MPEEYNNYRQDGEMIFAETAGERRVQLLEKNSNESRSAEGSTAALDPKINTSLNEE